MDGWVKGEGNSRSTCMDFRIRMKVGIGVVVDEDVLCELHPVIDCVYRTGPLLSSCSIGRIATSDCR